MLKTRVLALLALLVELVYCFPWDIVVGEDKRLEFYYNGTLSHKEDIPSANFIHSITYDPVQSRVLFADNNSPNMSISSFDLSTRKIQPLLTRKSSGYYTRVVYDPVTQLLFWRQYTSIYSFSLNPASSNKAVDGNLLVKLDRYCLDIAVDSCGGYIYWVTDYNVERARFDGSEREVLIDSRVFDRRSLAIDQQTQKIYWTENKLINGNYQLSIESGDFYGKNRTTLHTRIVASNNIYGYSLAVSKDFIYWMNYNQVGIWQLPKISSQQVEGKLFSTSSSICADCQHIAANYTMKEQIQGIKSCEALQYLITNNSKPESSVSICQNYCFQGDCNVSAEGQPTCSCKAGYSGERCEVNTCYKHCLNSGVCSLNEEDEPVCQCSAEYDGERCEVSTRKDNNCVSAEEETKFRCNASNIEEIKGNACHQYCLNDGICSLNEKTEPVCQCTADYEGERCDVPAFLIKCFLYAYKNVPSVTLSKAVKSTCATTGV